MGIGEGGYLAVIGQADSLNLGIAGGASFSYLFSNPHGFTIRALLQEGALVREIAITSQGLPFSL